MNYYLPSAVGISNGFLKKFILLIISAFTITLMSHSSLAQAWNMQVGSNLSDYNFTNSAGIKLTTLKPVSGFFFQSGFQHIVMDSSGRFNTHSLTGIFTFGVHVNYNQFNAMGIKGINSFSYQTDFLGLELNGGIIIPLFSGFAVKGLWHISANKLVHGYQMVNNDYYDLLDVEQFSRVQILSGSSLKLSKSVNPFIQIYVGYGESQSVFVKPYNGTTLSFEPKYFLIGIDFIVQKHPKKRSL
jgi:hypothetical protein